MSPTWLHWPSTWTPSDLSDLVVWLDADDTSFNNLDAVDAWTNKGTGGNTAQSDSAKRPVFKTNLLNGKPGIDFDGSNDCLQIASLALDTYISVFIVANTSASKPFFVEHSAASFSVDGFYFRGNSSDVYNVRRTDRNSYQGIASWWPSLSAAQACLVVDAIASAPSPMGSVYKDGTKQADGAVSGSNPARGASLSNVSLTETLNIGARDGGASAPTEGSINELIIYNAPLSQANREKVEGYLAHKWGLTASLPSGHPYKSSAP